MLGWIMVLGAAAAAFYLKKNFLNLMIKEMKSPYTHEETVRFLKESIEKRDGWHVFNIVDQGGEIRMNGGGDVGKITIIQYCHGPFASEMFKDDSRKKISVFSPKSISVYEKRDGGTYFSMMNGDLMKLVASGEMKRIVLSVSGEVKSIIASAIKGGNKAAETA